MIDIGISWMGLRGETSLEPRRDVERRPTGCGFARLAPEQRRPSARDPVRFRAVVLAEAGLDRGMVARSPSRAGDFAPTGAARVAVAADGSVAAVSEPSRITLLALPDGVAFAEIGVDPEAHASEIGWLGASPRLLVLSRYAAYSTAHLLDPQGLRPIAEIRLETPMRLSATVGATALVIGGLGAAVLAATETHLTAYPFPTRTVPLNAGAAAGQFVVALPASIEEWDPQSRMPRRRLRLPRAAAITAVGGSERMVWMTTQQEPARIDVIPLVNRGQPRAVDLPEPIASITGHPRSDLVACIGAETGRVYVIDLDGRQRLRILPPDGDGRIESAALVIGRMTGVLAAQPGHAVMIAALDGRDDGSTVSSVGIAIPLAAATAPPVGPAAPRADESPGAAEPASSVGDPVSWVGRSSLLEERGPSSAVSAAEDDPAASFAPVRRTPSMSLGRFASASQDPSVEPSAPGSEHAQPGGALEHADQADEVEPASGRVAAAFPTAPVARTGSVPTLKLSAEPAMPASVPGAPAGVPSRAAPAAPSRATPTAGSRSDPSASARFSAWRERMQQAAPAPELPMAPAPPVTPAPAAGSAPPVAPAPRASAPVRPAIAEREDRRASWRDDVVAWTRAITAAADDPAVPDAPPIEALIEALIARFDLGVELHPALVLLYGAHLCGERGAAPAEVARVLDGRWDEALGRGELAARGVVEYAGSRVALSPVVLRVLDELPPATGVLVGEPGSVVLLGPCVVVAGDEPLVAIAARCAPQIGGAILVATGEPSRAQLVLEARARGAAPMLRAALDAAPSDTAIFVVDDAELADRLGVPRLA
ncbi:MAG TPA: hypothetical protein VHW23_08515 [Kofleriaceae bacterium]|nr:hypothetical protein [Kofleriaceae bacterium]